MKGKESKKAGKKEGGKDVTRSASDSPGGSSTGNIEDTSETLLRVEDEPTHSGDEGESLDDRLEATAAKKNLSVTNVKSILHHLVKDQRVLKLVKRLAATEEGEEGEEEQEEGGEKRGESRSCDDWDELTAYEPRLTRSRVRKAVMSAVSAGSLSADKIALLKSSSSKPSASSKEKKERQDVSGSGDDESESSDEEYNPEGSTADEEEEEEEEEEEMEAEKREEVEVIKDVAGDREVEDDEEPMESENVIQQSATDRDPSPSPSSPSTPPPPPSPLPPTSSTVPPSSDSSSSHTHQLNQSKATPTITVTSAQSTPPQKTSPNLLSSQQLQHNKREIQETALLLASMASADSTLSPLKYLTAQQQTPELTTTVPGHVEPNEDKMEKPESIRKSVASNSTPLATAGLNSTGGESTAPVHNVEVSQRESQREGGGDGMELSVCGAGGGIDDVPGIFALTPSITISGESPRPEDKISQRTRSKHPLHDVSMTSLEAGLGLVEGEDPPTPRELDPDELCWHQWLNSLSTEPLNDSLASHVTEEEEEEDGEYNFLADCLTEEEKEEFRNDRAVRIPRKEVDDLITELLNPSTDVSGGRLLSDDGVDLTGAYLLETLGVQIPTLTDQTSIPLISSTAPLSSQLNDPLLSSSSPASPSASSSNCVLSREQTIRLWTQIQQHFQLIMQTFVLARFEPSLVFVSQVAAQALEEINQWCSSTKESGRGVWYIPDLQEGLDLFKTLDPYNDNAVKFTPSAGNPPKVSEGAQNVFMDTMLFWNYPQFLPAIGFTPLTANSASASKYFTPQEECLLVLGMEHYGANAWEDIQTNVLPTKTIKQLKLRVKNRCSKRSGKRSADNVIKEYKKTKKLPQITDDVTTTDIPQWINTHHKKLVGKEKEEMQKKQKQIDQVRKFLINSASKINTVKEPSNSQTHEATSSVVAIGTSSDLPRQSSSTSSSLRSSTVAVGGGGKRGCRDGGRSPVKRPRISASGVDERGGGGGGGGGGEEEREVVDSNGRRATLDHLLLAAGVEPSDPMARFSITFLRELKRVVSKSAPDTYQQFIQLLEHYSQYHWNPRELYRRVRELFEPWPHLTSLFTEFLSPQDCLEANVSEEKQEVESAKAFISNLKEKYGDAPLQMREIIETLQQLNTPTVTTTEVCESLLPMIQVHQDLSQDLRRLVFHLAPASRDDDTFEEVTLTGNNVPPDDEFEEVTLH